MVLNNNHVGMILVVEANGAQFPQDYFAEEIGRDIDVVLDKQTFSGLLNARAMIDERFNNYFLLTINPAPFAKRLDELHGLCLYAKQKNMDVMIFSEDLKCQSPENLMSESCKNLFLYTKYGLSKNLHYDYAVGNGPGVADITDFLNSARESAEKNKK